MKKTILAFLIITVISSLSGCGNNITTHIVNKSSDNSKLESYSSSEVNINDSNPINNSNDNNDNKNSNDIYEEKISTDESSSDFIDLTTLSSIMVYSKVNNMMWSPTDYIGKKIKLSGTYYTDYSENTQTSYHFVVIADATACCQQGIEFILNDGLNYPAKESECEIIGIFDSYEELGQTYYYIKADEIEFK